VAILPGEHVSGDEAGQDGKAPRPGEAQDDQRQREAGRVHPAPEERVRRHRALRFQDPGDGERRQDDDGRDHARRQLAG
jgi:hypothetical protein